MKHYSKKLQKKDQKERKRIISSLPLIRSPIKLWTGRSSASFPGAFSISLQSADLAQPGIPKVAIKDGGQIIQKLE